MPDIFDDFADPVIEQTNAPPEMMKIVSDVLAKYDLNAFEINRLWSQDPYRLSFASRLTNGARIFEVSSCLKELAASTTPSPYSCDTRDLMTFMKGLWSHKDFPDLVDRHDFVGSSYLDDPQSVLSDTSDTPANESTLQNPKRNNEDR
jgi:hypothetical protein